MTHDTQDHAYQNASAWMDSIIEYLAAIDCDYDRLEELRDRDDLDTDEAEELAELTASAGESDSQEQAEELARESILELKVRTDWHAPGDEDGNQPTEFFILLTTGGPALRIMGELGEHNEPSRAWLEYQDWGTPWTEYHGENADQDVLIRFSSLFYF